MAERKADLDGPAKRDTRASRCSERIGDFCLGTRTLAMSRRLQPLRTALTNY